MNTAEEGQLWDYYYDAMEEIELGRLPDAEKLLEMALRLDPDFVAAHVGMVAVNHEVGYYNGVREYSESGYTATKKQFPNWPRELPWGVTENRQYLRAICNKAALHQFDCQDVEADKLYRLILKLNPKDNQGVRYLLAGMYAGLSPNDVDDMFDYGNSKQNWDDLRIMLEEENDRHNFWKPHEI